MHWPVVEIRFVKEFRSSDSLVQGSLASGAYSNTNWTAGGPSRAPSIPPISEKFERAKPTVKVRAWQSDSSSAYWVPFSSACGAKISERTWGQFI